MINLLHTVAISISNRWVENGTIEEKLRPCYVYGLEIGFSTLNGLITVLLTGILCNKFSCAIIFLLMFIPLRQYTGGYHASSYLKCNISLICVFLINLLISSFLDTIKYTINSFLIISFIIAMGFIIIISLAPIANPNKDLTQKEKKAHKRIAIYIYSIEIIMCMITFKFNVNSANVMAVTLLEMIVLMIIGKIKNRRIYNDKEKT